MFMVTGWPWSGHLWSKLWSVWIHKWPILWLPWFNDEIKTGFFESIKPFLSAMWCIWGRFKLKQFPKLKLTFAFCRKHSYVCLHSKHILTNCVFFAVFPTIVHLFELSFSFPPLFQCSLPLKFFSIGFFESVKIFFCIFAGLFWDHFLVVCPVKWDLTYHKLGAPETQYEKLNIYKCTLQTQLTIVSDEFFETNFIRSP